MVAQLQFTTLTVRNCIPWMMERAGAKNSNVKKRQFWQQHNKPIELWSADVTTLFVLNISRAVKLFLRKPPIKDIEVGI